MALQLKPLHKQVIVVTGASSGIGLATLQATARQGAKLVLTSRNEEALKDVEQEINATGGQAIYIAADIANREGVQRGADAAIAHFGGFNTRYSYS